MLHPALTRATGTSRRRRIALALTSCVALLALPSTGSGPAEAAPASACAAAPIDADFDDVGSGNIFGEAIACVAGYGLVGGYPDDTYRPGDRVTRGEAAKFVLSAIETASGVQLPDPDGNPFRDVSATGVLGPHILRLETAGIVGGKSSTRYAPGDPLTRGEMSAIVATALVETGVALDDTDVDYPDVPDDGTFARAISMLTNAEIVQGLRDGTFSPGRPVTRGELAAFVANSIETIHGQDLWLPTIDEHEWETLRGSLQHMRISAPGPRVINVLRWQLGDPELKLRVDYAGGATYRDTVVNAARRKGALAAVNGGFWINGVDPDGLLVRDARLDSDTSTLIYGHRNIRSGFGLHRDDTPIVGVPRWYGSLTLQGPDGTKSVRIDGVNRRPLASDKVVVFAPGTYAESTSLPGRYYVFDEVVDLNRSGTHELTVARMHVGEGPVAAGRDEMLIWMAADLTLAEAPDDRTPTLRVQMDPAWENTRVALVAGPWLLEDGATTPEWQWRNEGFGTSHTDKRHPRSAIGFTDDGWAYIATVDGRRPGASIGSTHEQVASMLRSRWGVDDAVMLDGGGSTQMAIDGQLANRPCCDPTSRTVATVLLLQPRSG